MCDPLLLFAVIKCKDWKSLYPASFCCKNHLLKSALRYTMLMLSLMSSVRAWLGFQDNLMLFCLDFLFYFVSSILSAFFSCHFSSYFSCRVFLKTFLQDVNEAQRLRADSWSALRQTCKLCSLESSQACHDSFLLRLLSRFLISFSGLSSRLDCRHASSWLCWSSWLI